MEYVKLSDRVFFTVNFYHPSGSFSISADSTPEWFVYENDTTTPMLNGTMSARTNHTGLYYGDFHASGYLGFEAGKFYDVQASGAVDSIEAMVSVKQFVVNDVFDANIVQVSGELVSVNDFKADLTNVNPDIYFANIKYIKDTINDQDEFGVQWYKNDQPVSSGNLTTPAISLYNTTTGVAVFADQKMTYASPNLGVVRYNNSSVMASGEPYLVVTSGVIDASLRTWRAVVGIDSL